MRRSRRKLAPPFVVTLALLPAACTPQETPKVGDTKPTTTATVATITGHSPSASASGPDSPPPPSSIVGHENPPPPPSASAHATAAASWRVLPGDKPGACEVKSLTQASAPQMKMKCPPGMSDKALTLTRAAGAADCEYTVFRSGGSCPPGARCNPPPPEHRHVACPPERAR